MSTEKMFGKIHDLKIGFVCGRDDSSFGVRFDIRGKGWGTGGELYLPIEMGRLKLLMNDANVTEIMKLKDKPLEVTFEGGTLSGFRILTEVI